MVVMRRPEVWGNEGGASEGKRGTYVKCGVIKRNWREVRRIVWRRLGDQGKLRRGSER